MTYHWQYSYKYIETKILSCRYKSEFWNKAHRYAEKDLLDYEASKWKDKKGALEKQASETESKINAILQSDVPVEAIPAALDVVSNSPENAERLPEKPALRLMSSSLLLLAHVFSQHQNVVVPPAPPSDAYYPFSILPMTKYVNWNQLKKDIKTAKEDIDSGQLSSQNNSQKTPVHTMFSEIARVHNVRFQKGEETIAKGIARIEQFHKKKKEPLRNFLGLKKQLPLVKMHWKRSDGGARL